MVELKHVSKYFGKKEAVVKALQDVSITIQEGEMVAIMGKRFR